MIGLSPVRDRGSLLALLSVVVASLLACSSAQAAIVTVGSPLTVSFAPVTIATPGLLATNLKLGETGAQATSPADGAVIGWRMFGEGSFELRLVRSEPAGNFLAGAASAPQTLGTYGLDTFTTDLPVKVGELVGIQTTSASARIGTNTFAATGSTAATWETAPESVATGPDGGAPESEFGFSATVLPAPTVVSVAPASGPIAGGTSITVTGTDFTDVEGVSIGSVPAASYSVTSEGQLTAVAPAGATAGAVPVSVTTEAGTASSAQSFTYSAPTPPASTGPAPSPPAQATPGCVVPKLHGKKLKAARKIAAKADCKLGKVTRKGATGKRAKVVKQKPKAGTTRAPRTKVDVVLGGG